MESILFNATNDVWALSRNIDQMNYMCLDNPSLGYMSYFELYLDYIS